ncbi:MAG: hypothetical protein NXI04_04380 [Planctomycetaceae bacterium]|nr:hypothetical protein [Planctomycetaceae bacterium]
MNTSPIRIELDSGVSITFLLFAAIVGFIVLRGVVRLFSGANGSDSVLKALGITAVVVVAMMMLAATLYTSRQASSVTVHTARSSSSVLQDVESSSAVVVSDTSLGGISTTTTADGEMLVLPLSNQVLADLIGEEGVAAIEKLNETVPPELRQAYAMIPITGPASGTVAPVLRGTLGPAVMSEQGMNLIQSTVSNLLPTEIAEKGLQLMAEAADGELADGTFEAPDWVEAPGEGFIVVKSEFALEGEPVGQVLRPAIEEALITQVESLISERFHTDDGWKQYVSLAVSDEAIEECIVKTAEETELLPTTGGTFEMQRTYALIDLPETLKEGTVASIRSSIQQSRMMSLGLTVAIAWLAALFLGVGARVAQSRSTTRKVATLPIVGLMIVPCGVAFCLMVGAMTSGETLDFSWADEPMTCVIDSMSESSVE